MVFFLVGGATRDEGPLIAISKRLLNLSDSLYVAFSYHCIVSYTGTIDEVSQEINMTWVQPRVLDLPQVCPCMKYCVLAYDRCHHVLLGV